MTAQIADALDHQGQTHKLFTNPLEFLLDGRRPAFVGENSALWRGYVALWEIRNDRLYLKDLHGRVCVAPADGGIRQAACGKHHAGRCDVRDARFSDLAPLFALEDGQIPADWFSGDLCVPQGRMLDYVHMGYASRYERYLIIEIAHGAVVSSRLVSEHDERAARLAALERARHSHDEASR